MCRRNPLLVHSSASVAESPLSAQPPTAMAQQEGQDFTGGAVQPTFCELPDNTAEITVGFYNVGIHASEVQGKMWKTKERQLQADILKAFDTHALDILCLSELGELGDGIRAELPEGDVTAWIAELLKGSGAPPVDVYSDSHYSTIVKTTRVRVDQYRLVAGFVPSQKDRSFQHVRVRVDGDQEPVSIINCHAPASKKRGLNVDGRTRYFTAFKTACDTDRFIWGGDFNTGLIQFTALIQGIDPRYREAQREASSVAQPGNLQFVFSHPLRFKQGDMAVTYGFCSVQVNSEVGRFCGGVSDAHDLVIAKVFATEDARRPPVHSSGSAVPSRQPLCPMPVHPAPMPKQSARASNCAAEPAQAETRVTKEIVL